jgi:hypothetical protein
VTARSRWIGHRVAVGKGADASRKMSALRMLISVLSVSASLMVTATASAVVVTTGEPLEISPGAATFTGTVTGGVPGSTFHFQFWWDSYPQHVNQTTTEPLPQDPEVHVTQKTFGVTSMVKAGLDYTYQLVVEEPGGVVVGQPVSFQTPPTLYEKAPPPPGTCRVRKVTGLRLANARRVLHAPGCGQIRIVVLPQGGQHLHARRSYRIVSQSPSAGSRIPWYHSSVFLRVK